MKPRLSSKRTTALTRIEVVVIIAVFGNFGGRIPAGTRENQTPREQKLIALAVLNKLASPSDFGKVTTTTNIQWQFR